MALETATYVANLVVTNPDGGDARSTADDHLRLIKGSLVRTFPLLDGAVSLSAVQYMYLADLSASVQLQLNQLRDGSATANNAINSRFANSASLALSANSASWAVLAGHAVSASFANLATLATNATNADTADNATNAVFAATAGSAQTANSASYATIAALANTATSASSAQTLAGYEQTDAPTANTIARRGASGTLEATYFRHTVGVDPGSVGHVFTMRDADGYLRPVTTDAFGAYVSARNISTKSGTNKTLAAGSGPPSLTGSTNGDIWYLY
jgi:hypothetical protein